MIYDKKLKIKLICLWWKLSLAQITSMATVLPKVLLWICAPYDMAPYAWYISDWLKVFLKVTIAILPYRTELICHIAYCKTFYVTFADELIENLSFVLP